MEQQLIELLQPLLAKYPVIVTVLLAVGTLRLFFKPIMSGIEVAVSQSESKKDDEILGKVKSNVFYRGLVWLVDLLGSIKLPVKK
jgi:hypothetical protein